ncbi:MAG: hypothetical protein QGG36_20985 [Pirellulaceae bacterium]|jgi:hypothetical protein|nr:hypothetical protein [Pirellulaceae bacterium]MDP7018294.1 hypothetical protein [Pirellulaceae bacterium]
MTMASIAPEHPAVSQRRSTTRGLRTIGVVCTAIVATAWATAVWLPLGVSMLAVFLFAAPHNWMECRYFLQRMPGRWGPLRLYYWSGLGGAFLLAAASLLLPSTARAWALEFEAWMTLLAVWNSALVAWVVWLAYLRRREKLQRAATRQPAVEHNLWPLLFAGGWVLIAVAWLAPVGWSLALVYLHPLIALWFLDRELLRRRVAWHGVYRAALGVLPFCLAGLWWMLWSKPDLPGDDLVSLQITRHAGRGVVPGVSTHLLVATHVFLEMLHYAVWLLAIPSIGMLGKPWQLDKMPMARKSAIWKWGVATVLLVGGVAVIGFWGGFAANYPATRDIYFAVAILHVLTEAPFLIRLL